MFYLYLALILLTAAIHIGLWLLMSAKPKPKPQATVAPLWTSCENCCKGVEELSRTTITGSWCCSSCGCFHSFVDGIPGSPRPYEPGDRLDTRA